MILQPDASEGCVPKSVEAASRRGVKMPVEGEGGGLRKAGGGSRGTATVRAAARPRLPTGSLPESRPPTGETARRGTGSRISHAPYRTAREELVNCPRGT